MPVLGVDGRILPRKTVSRQQGAKRKRRKRPAPRLISPLLNTGIGRRTRHFTLYVLELEGGYYYVGITAYKDVRRRYAQHVSGKGARWTAKHLPLRIIETRTLGLLHEERAGKIETQVTLDYIKLYGLAKVRGGALCRVSDAAHAADFNRLSTVKSTCFYDPLKDELRWLYAELMGR